MISELIDIAPKPGSTIFLKSVTDPFTPEMEIPVLLRSLGLKVKF